MSIVFLYVPLSKNLYVMLKNLYVMLKIGKKGKNDNFYLASTKKFIKRGEGLDFTSKRSLYTFQTEGRAVKFHSFYRVSLDLKGSS